MSPREHTPEDREQQRDDDWQPPPAPDFPGDEDDSPPRSRDLPTDSVRSIPGLEGEDHGTEKW